MTISQYEKQKKLKQKVDQLVNERIRQVTKRDRMVYNGVFAYPVMKLFGKPRGLPLKSLVLILTLDLFPYFTYKDAIIWGIYDHRQNFSHIIMQLHEYVDRYSKGRGTKYFLTLKGKLLVKEFNEFYDEYVKKVTKTIPRSQTTGIN